MLSGKKILLGVCGGIAAYKSAVLVRLLVKAGAEVQVVMTQAAHSFVAPLTFSTLSKKPVLTAFADDQGNWNNHVDLGLWADCLLIAPATANTLGKMANGLADNLLVATYLSARCPVVVSPAMDVDMWQHPSTNRNINLLRQDGVQVVPVGSGELASGLVGEGRMAEPEDIVAFVENEVFADKPEQTLTGKQVLITAGPTVEHIDPVRYITNHSSGKMGFALADAFRRLGAQVTVVAGPVTHRPQLPNVKVIDVTSAAEMFEAADSLFGEADIAVMAAAVSDYTPATPASQKIKKSDSELNISLKKTTDILATLGQQKRADQLVVGFALETNNEIENARKKLEEKNADMVVLNSLNDQGAGFGHDTNQITVLYRNQEPKSFGLRSKKEVASDIVNEIVNLLHA